MNNKEGEKIRHIMLGALYTLGDPKQQESLLDAWKLSKNQLISFNINRLT